MVNRSQLIHGIEVKCVQIFRWCWGSDSFDSRREAVAIRYSIYDAFNIREGAKNGESSVVSSLSSISSVREGAEVSRAFVTHFLYISFDW